jgi:hypothetical protein
MRSIATYAPIFAIKRLMLFLRATIKFLSPGGGREEEGQEEAQEEKEISKFDRWRREPLSVRAGRWSNRRSAEIRSDWPFLWSR